MIVHKSIAIKKFIIYIDNSWSKFFDCLKGYTVKEHQTFVKDVYCFYNTSSVKKESCNDYTNINGLYNLHDSFFRNLEKERYFKGKEAETRLF